MALSKEQLDFIECENKNILVSASAGSGKTFSMIKKLSYLLCEKRIRCTFTRKSQYRRAAARLYALSAAAAKNTETSSPTYKDYSARRNRRP